MCSNCNFGLEENVKGILKVFFHSRFHPFEYSDYKDGTKAPPSKLNADSGRMRLYFTACKILFGML